MTLIVPPLAPPTDLHIPASGMVKTGEGDLEIEKNIINLTHNAAIASIFNAFKENYSLAKDDRERDAVKERFKKGIQKARDLRNLAISALPPQK